MKTPELTSGLPHTYNDVCVHTLHRKKNGQLAAVVLKVKQMISGLVTNINNSYKTTTTNQKKETYCGNSGQWKTERNICIWGYRLTGTLTKF